MEIERLSARVDVDARAAERALDRLDRKLNEVSRERAGVVLLQVVGESDVAKADEMADEAARNRSADIDFIVTPDDIAELKLVDELADEAAEDRTGHIRIVTDDTSKVKLLADEMTELDDSLNGIRVNLRGASKDFDGLLDDMDNDIGAWERLRDAIDSSDREVSGWINNVFRQDWRKWGDELDDIGDAVWRIGQAPDWDFDAWFNGGRRDRRQKRVGDLLSFDIGDDGSVIETLVGSIGELGDVASTAARKVDLLGDSGDGASSGLTNLGGAAGGAGRGFNLLAAKASLLGGALFVLLPAIVAIGPALTALGGYVIGLVAAFAPLVGLLFTLPALLGGLMGVVAVIGLIAKPITEALQWLGEEEETHKANVLALEQANWSLVQAERSAEQSKINLANATIGLADAHREAAERIEDAQFAARSAQLSEERAVLGLERAYKRLADVQAGIAGKTEEITKVTDDFTGKQFEVTRITYDAVDAQEDIRDALLGVREAELNLEMARDAREDSERTLRDLEAKGIENSDLVVAANQRIADATWAVENAERALQDALRERDEAKLTLDTESEAMDKLSDDSQGLIERIKGLMDSFDELGVMLLDSLAPALDEVLDHAQPFFDALPDILGPIARGIGAFLDGFAETFFTEDNIANLVEFAEELEDVFGTLGPIFGTFAEGMLNLSLAVMPLIERIVGLLGVGGENFNRWTEEGTDTRSIEEWFDLTGDVLEDTLAIIGNLIEMAGGFIDALADSGFLDWIREGLVEWTQAGEDWAESMEGQEQIATFFESLKEPLSALASLLGTIGGLWMEAFGDQEAMDFLTHFLEVTEKDVMPVLFGLFDMMIESGFLDGIVDLVGSLVKVLAAFAQFQGVEESMEAFGHLASIVSVVLEGVAGIFGVLAEFSPNRMLMGASGFLLEFFDVEGLREGIETFFRELPENIALWFSDWDWGVLWDGFVEAFWVVWDPVAEAINDIIGIVNKAPGVSLPDLPTSSNRGSAGGGTEINPDGFYGIIDVDRYRSIIEGETPDILASQYTSSRVPGTGSAQGGAAVNNDIDNHFYNFTDPAEVSRDIAWQLSSTTTEYTTPGGGRVR